MTTVFTPRLSTLLILYMFVCLFVCFLLSTASDLVYDSVLIQDFSSWSLRIIKLIIFPFLFFSTRDFHSFILTTVYIFFKLYETKLLLKLICNYCVSNCIIFIFTCIKYIVNCRKLQRFIFIIN